MLGDKVYDPLAPEIDLPVLLAAAEDGFTRLGRERKLIGPARFSRELKLRAAVDLAQRDEQRVALGGKPKAAVRLALQLGQRNTRRHAGGHFDGAAVGLIAFFAAHSRGKGVSGAVRQKRYAVEGKLQMPIGAVNGQHGSASSCFFFILPQKRGGSQ